MVIKYVAGDGTGDYDADGSGDQATINRALSWAADNPGNEVHLVGPFTYDIGTSVLIGSNTKFTGDSDAILRLNNSCTWKVGVPIVGQIGGTGTVSKNIEISGFQIDGNESHLYGVNGHIRGEGFYNMIHIQGQKAKRASNIKIHHMKMYNGMGDGPRLVFCDDPHVYNCDLQNLMHCSVFCIECNGALTFSNTIKAISCSGVRYDHCRNGSIYSNNIADFTGTTNAPKFGEYGVQIGLQPPKYGHTTLVDNIIIRDNVIDVSGSGVQIEDYLKSAGSTAQKVTITNNLIRGGKYNGAAYFAGVVIYSWGNGLTISRNTIDGSGRAGILGYNAINSSSKVFVTYNNIINTVKLGGDGGYGIWNRSSALKISASNNYLSGNISGKYKGITPLSESSSYLDYAVPGSTPETPDPPDEPDEPDTPDEPDIPPVDPEDPPDDPVDPVDPDEPYVPIEPIDPNPPAVGCAGVAILSGGKYVFLPYKIPENGDDVLLVPTDSGYIPLKLANEAEEGSNLTIIQDNKGNYYAIEGV